MPTAFAPQRNRSTRFNRSDQDGSTRSNVIKHGGFVALVWNDKVAVVETHDRRGFFQLPGGVVENGETVEQATVREAREELGIDLSAEQLRYLLECESDTTGGRLRCYVAYVTDSLELCPAHEITDVRWVSLREVGKLPAYPASRKMFRTLAAAA